MDPTRMKNNPKNTDRQFKTIDPIMKLFQIAQFIHHIKYPSIIHNFPHATYASKLDRKKLRCDEVSI